MPDRTSSEIVDREYLELRAKILELAASFDRIERAGESVGSLAANDPRMEKIAAGLAILRDEEGSKAERVQLLFSRAYSDQWREQFGIQG